MRGTVRHVEWTGDEDTERLEAAVVTFAHDRLDALGTSRTTDYVASWVLVTDPDWVTRRLAVCVSGRTFTRTLELTRDGHGRWNSSSSAQGDAEYQGEPMPRPGLSDVSAVDGALDCDLALCPVTNTMPIRRLGALEGLEETELTMAWVALPSLAVTASRQAYSAAAGFDPSSGWGVVRYRSLDSEFAADLTVDEDGLVVDYPGIARRIGTA